MRYRILTSKDIKPCNELLSTNISLRITPPPTALSVTNNYLNDSYELMSIFGEYSDSGELVACIFVTFSADNRSWTIDYIIKMGNKNIKSIIGLLQYVLEYAERQNYHTMYVVYFDNHDKRCEKFLRYFNIVFPRYTATTETVISNNRKSSFLWYWEIFQKFTIHDRRMIIRQYSLNQIYRNII